MLQLLFNLIVLAASYSAFGTARSRPAFCQFLRESFSKAGNAAFAVKTPRAPQPRILQLEFLVISEISEPELHGLLAIS